MKTLSPLLFLIFIFSGCALLGVNRPTVLLEVRSTPGGATAKLSTGEKCRTPCSIRVHSDGDNRVTISKEGYKSASRKVRSIIPKKTPAKGTVDQVMKAIQPSDPAVLKPNPVIVKLQPEWTKP